LVILKLSLGTTALTLQPLPEAFWQLVQWQARRAAIGALTV
jgi:hypothetical protein